MPHRALVVVCMLCLGIPALAEQPEMPPPEDENVPDPADLLGAGRGEPIEQPKRADDEPGGTAEPKRWEGNPEAADQSGTIQASAGSPRSRWLLERGKFTMNPIGRVQAAADLFVGELANVDNGDAATFEGFRLRRARLGVYGDVYRDVVGYELEMDLRDAISGGGVDLLDAFLEYKRERAVALRAGAQKVPVGWGSLTSSSSMLMAERPLEAFIVERDTLPARQVGFALFGNLLDDGALSYDFGVYNGTPDITQGNITGGFLTALRVGYTMGDFGYGESDLEGGPLRVRAAGNGYFQVGGLAGDTVGFGGDVAVKVEGLSAVVSYLEQHIEPVTVPVSTPAAAGSFARRFAFGQAGYMVAPGLLEIAARVEWVDDNEYLKDEGDGLLITGGLNVYLDGHRMKGQLNFIRRQELQGLEIDNDVLLLQLQAAF